MKAIYFKLFGLKNYESKYFSTTAESSDTFLMGFRPGLFSKNWDVLDKRISINRVFG